MRGANFDGQFEFVPHTADIAVRLRSRTLGALFEAAAAGFTEALTDLTSVTRATERRIDLAAPDLEQLLVDWLEELLFLFETQGFLPRETDVTITNQGTTVAMTNQGTKITKGTKSTKEGHDALSTPGDRGDHPRDLRAHRGLRDQYVIAGTLRGEPRDPSRHPLKLLIKAVTYHGLHVAETRDGYEATVIFDI